jgi:hypothetical protein
MATTYIFISQFITIIRFFIQHYLHVLDDEERLNKLLANKLQNSTPSHFYYSCCLMTGTEHVSLLVKVSSRMPYVYVRVSCYQIKNCVQLLLMNTWRDACEVQ